MVSRCAELFAWGKMGWGRDLLPAAGGMWMVGLRVLLFGLECLRGCFGWAGNMVRGPFSVTVVVMGIREWGQASRQAKVFI